jgi:hypothetical protein
MNSGLAEREVHDFLVTRVYILTGSLRVSCSLDLILSRATL